ncbi:MAG: LysR family transcriptional regulator [Burkholderiales bacterium]
MDKLLSMEVFVTAVETGGFTAAAEVFQISPPMVGKHVRKLEAQLGVRLLSRTTRRQSLTEAGRQYYERCKFILEEIKAAEAGIEVMRATPRGNLRINAPVSFGSSRLAPALAQYLAAYPEVSIELTLNDKIVDLTEEGYDVAIRIGKLTDSNLVARRLAPYRMMICAAPDYLERAGTPTTPADLASHQCLGFSRWSKRGGWNLQHNPANFSAGTNIRFRSNHGHALRMMALAGFGIIMQPEVLLADDVMAGKLAEILKEFWPSPRPMHLLYSRDRQAVPKLTTFIEFMLAQFSEPGGA